jgi:predicted trehalose synthase
VIGAMLDLDEGRREAFIPLVSAWLARRSSDAGGAIEVVEVEVLLAGRPGLLDVVARVDDRLAHLVVGLHDLGSEIKMLRGADDGVLGEFADDRGRALAVDALWDAEMASLITLAIVGEEPGVLSMARDDDLAVVLDIEDRCSFSVFPWLTEGPHPGVEMLVTLDEAGFNHLAAPIALWRRQGRDLGIVQELLMGRAGGWALALTSLRDLYGSGVRPEQAGGDFAIEARSLGTMFARLHLAADKAFGRQIGAVADWARDVESTVQALDPQLLRSSAVSETLEALRARSDRLPMVRTHGDLHLGRTARTDQGWVVADWLPGGVDAHGTPLFRSPLADVADLLWSLHYVAAAALDERDPALRPRLEPSAEAWEARNRRAFLAGYLETPGIDELVPADAPLVEKLLSAFEVERAALRSDQ